MKLEKILKKLNLDPILTRLANIWVPKTFFEAFTSTRC